MPQLKQRIGIHNQNFRSCQAKASQIFLIWVPHFCGNLFNSHGSLVKRKLQLARQRNKELIFKEGKVKRKECKEFLSKSEPILGWLYLGGVISGKHFLKLLLRIFFSVYY